MQAHVLSSLCQSDWVSIGLNVAAAAMAVSFAVSLHLFETHQRHVERVASIRNPYDGFMSFTFWASVASAVALVGVVVYQIAHRKR